MFDLGDTETMIQQVRDLVENPAKLKAMRQAARERMCRTSWAEVMDELIVTYDHVIQNYHQKNN